MRRTLASIGAMVAIGVPGGFVIAGIGDSTTVNGSSLESFVPRGDGSAEAAIPSVDGVSQVLVADVDAPGASAHPKVEGDQAMLVAERLPAPPEERTYQV